MSERWIYEWQQGFWQSDVETVEWLKSRPESIKHLLYQFPPSCLVVAKRALNCPAPNEIGIVTSYSDPDESSPRGLISVRANPSAAIRHQCDPDWLEVVGYYKGITTNILKQIIES